MVILDIESQLLVELTYLVSQLASFAITFQLFESFISTVRKVCSSSRLFLGWPDTCNNMDMEALTNVIINLVFNLGL